MEQLDLILLYGSLPGMAGGVICVLIDWNTNHYKIGKLVPKACVEILGASLTATFLSFLFVGDMDNEHLMAISFLIGVRWLGIIEIVRDKVTKIVEAIIGEKFKDRD